MSTTDPLGSLFARLRDAVEDDPAEGGAVEGHPVGHAGEAPSRAACPADVPGVATPDAPGAEPEFVIVATDLVASYPVEPEPHWPIFAVAESATLDDDGLRRRRDATVDTAVALAEPKVKRLVHDEQNEILDTIRRQRGRGDPRAALGTASEQVARWIGEVGPILDQCYAAGRTLGGGRTRPAPGPLTEQLVTLVVEPLRERLLASIDAAVAHGPHDGPADLQRVVASALGARYREWRSQELRGALGDLAASAFARGVFDATPDGVRLRWVPAEVQRCPDADDNALEPTERGLPFPTGQSCPPAHPGCRCLVVPVAGGDGREHAVGQ